MEKPTKAFFLEIINAKNPEEREKIIGTATTVYANLIVELVQSFPEKDLPMVLFALGSVKETFAELSPVAELISDEMGKGLKRQVFVSK